MKKTTNSGIESLIAGLMGILALLVFALHIYWSSSPLSTKETTLFSLLQFLLSVGFGWFSTRAISRREFQESLRQFAISAYRRTADIDLLLARLKMETHRIGNSDSQLREKLYAVESMLIDSSQIVRSSLSDWADVVGREAILAEKLERLEQEQTDLRHKISTNRKDSHSENRLRRINQEISTILTKLYGKSDTKTYQIDQDVEEVAKWIAREHYKYKKMELVIVTGDLYRQEKHPENISLGDLCRLVDSEEDGTTAIDAVDSNGAIVGRLQNLSPVSYDSFTLGLKRCYGGLPLTVKVVSVDTGEHREDGYYSWLHVIVQREPAIEF